MRKVSAQAKILCPGQKNRPRKSFLARTCNNTYAAAPGCSRAVGQRGRGMSSVRRKTKIFLQLVGSFFEAVAVATRLAELIGGARQLPTSYPGEIVLLELRSAPEPESDRTAMTWRYKILL